MKDKTDYEIKLEEFAEAYDDYQLDEHVEKAFIAGADWSRRFSYTQDKVIADAMWALKTARNLLASSEFISNDIDKYLNAFAEEKKKWSGEK